MGAAWRHGAVANYSGNDTMKYRAIGKLFGLAALAMIAVAAAAPSGYAQNIGGVFLGEVRTFGFNFCPRGWAPADGRLLPVSQYTALFSLLGTQYGGDGRTTVGLPDLRGTIHDKRQPFATLNVCIATFEAIFPSRNQPSMGCEIGLHDE